MVFVDSVAGTGKSTAALYEFVKEYIHDNSKQILVVRSPVEAGGLDKIGFLPNELSQKSIREWQPTEISIKNNIATVVLPGKTLTPDAYEAVITSGVCMSIWTKSTPKDFLSDIKLLHVVNMYKSIGFTLENPTAIS